MTVHGAGHCSSTAFGKDVTTMNEISVLLDDCILAQHPPPPPQPAPNP